ncbi:MAG: YncE family protein [Blastocatellia bacterium]
MKKISLLLVSIGLLLLLPSAFSKVLPSAAGYHVVKKIPVGGEGGWDYLMMDSAARRLYVSHATKVVVIDVDKNEVVGEIANLKGVHGIAIAPELNRGFTSNGGDATTTIFDLKTLKTIGSAKTGGNPDCIIFDPASKRVFTFNRTRAAADASSTVIEAATGEVAGTIMLGGRPEFAVADGKGQIFVNLDDKSEIAVIDSRKMTVTNRWPLAPGKGPSGLAMDVKNRRLFSVCGDNQKMIVMNADNGKIVEDVPIGRGTDAAAFDPGTGLAFSSNGDGTLTVVHKDSSDKFSVVENAKTLPRARTMALDVKTHRIYLSTAEYGLAPAATAEQPNPRPAMVPGSFMILVLDK